MATTDQPIIDSNMFGWNRQGQYYTINITLEPGYGYWIYAYESCEVWIQYTIHPSDNYITNVKSGWNTVSIPYNQPINKTDILVNDSSWPDAVIAGFIDDNVFGWDGTIQTYYIATTFSPGYAYWLYAYQPCTLKRNI